MPSSLCDAAVLSAIADPISTLGSKAGVASARRRSMLLVKASGTNRNTVGPMLAAATIDHAAAGGFQAAWRRRQIGLPFGLRTM
jgi:hypothetical protein